MGIQGSKNDLAALQSLMALIFNLIIADVFSMVEREITPDLRLIDDLKMTAAQKSKLEALLADYFDGIRLDWRSKTTLHDLYLGVVEEPFYRPVAGGFVSSAGIPSSAQDAGQQCADE